MHTTRASLLLRLRDAADQDAWAVFDEIYRPILYRFSRARGLAHEDAEDVVQHAFAAVHDKIAAFDYEPRKGRFRSWLFTIVANRVRNLARDREVAEMDRASLQERESARAGRILSPEEVFEGLWMQEHLWHCVREVRAGVDDRTFEVFRRLVFDEDSVEEVCRDLGVESGNAYTIKWRLTKQVAQRMTELTGDDGD